MSTSITRTPGRLLATVAAAGLCLTLAPVAQAVPAAGTATTGLFGTADPTYDGAYRQSLAVLGLAAAHAPIPAAAVTWLMGQQCPSGAFEAFRADPNAPCSTPDPAAFTGPDSNSTALAAMALKAAGRSAAAVRAVAALTSVQNPDGGWGYTLGGASDVNSTGLALAAVKGAASAAGTSSRSRRSIARASTYLSKAQIACTAPITSRFGMPYQPGQAVSALASAQALVGLAGTLPVRHTVATSLAGTGCRSAVVRQVSAYLDRLLRTTGGRIPSVLDDKQVDWNTTAGAVLALGAAGAGPGGISRGLAALGRDTSTFPGAGTTASPAGTGTLIQAAVAGGASPRAFGTAKVNLVRLLLGTLQK
jgi:hypothetical protein